MNEKKIIPGWRIGRRRRRRREEEKKENHRGAISGRLVDPAREPVIDG
jgi:hypothetical protein